MASSPPPPGGGPSSRDPMTVGRNFVKQYYHCLSTSPEKIVKFYKPVSVFSNGQGSVPTTPTLFAESNDLLKDRPFSAESFRLDLEHGAIDAQMGVGGGVLVVVTGHLVIEEERRAFCHTFFLNVFSAPDSKKNLYYVHNDIMRFLADEGKKEEAIEEEEVAAEVTQEEIVVEKAQEAVAETTDEATAAVIDAAEAAATEPETVPEPAVVVEETPMYEPALEPEPAVEETKENIVEERDSKSKRKGKSRGGRKKSLSPTSGEDGKKKQAAPGSWASMVAHAASAPVPPSPTRKKETGAAKGESNKSEKPAVQEQQQQQHQQGKQKRNPKLRDPDCTLVIKNVPEGTREREVRELFEPFARETKSKIVGLNVSGSKSLAFVDYDSPEPVIMALKAKRKFQLQGRNLELEPKMVTKNQPKGGSGGRHRGQQGGDGSSNGFRGSGGSGQHRRRGSGGGRGDRSGGGGKGGRGGR